MDGGSFRVLFNAFAWAIGVVVIAGAAGAFVGLLARSVRDRLTSTASESTD
jgi:hypothetical protein